MKFALLGSASALAASFAPPAGAQSTDGYHSIQVFPMVVDTASFKQRFNFRNPSDAETVTIQARYFPGDGTSATAMTCPDFVVAPGKTVVFDSLLALCPALPGGSQFGFVHTREISSSSLPYAAFSRVSNPAGNGFTVEAFAASSFTSADSVVNGIRRLAATATTPAFQTNCFIANLNDLAPAAARPNTQVNFTISNSASSSIGGGTLNIAPGRFVRLLDVFAAGSVPAGDYNDAQIRFEELSAGEPALMTWCTVQDNTSFGADFRIGKQERAAGGRAYPGDVVGAQSNHVARETLTDSSGGRTFTIAAGANANTHVMYFHHPDYVQCEIVNPATGQRALAGYGLELRMLDDEGQVLAGGDKATGWGDLYLGDRTDRNGGADARYTLQVEDAETNSGVARNYQLHCRSGSGHTLGDLIRYQEAGNNF